MDKVTVTTADGASTDYFPQAYTDQAVATALTGTTPAVAPEAVEVDLVLSDGSTKKFVAA